MSSSRRYLLSVFLVAGAFLIHKPPFRDEPLYLEYARGVLENPREPYPGSEYVPHPPGLRYLIALSLALGANPRVLLASLVLLLALAFYRDSFAVPPGLAIYAFILFDDALGAILAALAISFVERRNYKAIPFAFLAASMIRYQSVLVALAYASRERLRTRDHKLLGSLSALPAVLASPHKAAHALSITRKPFAYYAIHLANPAFVPLVALGLRDREALKVLAASYIVNSALAMFHYPYGYPRYYLTAAVFAGSKIRDEDLRSLFGPVAGFLTTLYLRPYNLVVLASLAFPERLRVSSRLVTLLLSREILAYAVPHPRYRISRGEYHHRSGLPRHIIVINKTRGR